MIDSQTKKDSGRKLFYGLFIFPLVIAVGMAVLLCTVVLLTQESETPESLITSIKTGAPSKRWQKAFELSNELNQGRGMIRQAGVMKEVIHILNDRDEYDPKTRSFMAMALSKFEEPQAAEALRQALLNEKNEDVQLYLIWALGIKRDKQAVNLVTPFLENSSEELRKIAVYVLGMIGESEHTSVIKPLLSDKARDVRWNSALALARLGSDAGYEEILKMLDRKTLSVDGNLSDKKKEEIMINAVKGLALIQGESATEVLTQVSKKEKSLKVRRVALEALEQRKLV